MSKHDRLRYADLVRWVLVFAGAVSACSLLTDLGPLGGDGGADVTLDVQTMDAPPADGFLLTVSPTHLTMDPGDSDPVTINIARGSAFTDTVNVTINGLNPPYLTGPATTAIIGASAIAQIALPQAPPNQTDPELTFVGVAMNGKTSSAKLSIHVGSLLVATTTDTTVQIPSFASTVLVKAWGAGGGGGISISDGTGNLFYGGTGGGGGFASGTISVTPGETLQVWVGGGGATSGYGGGFSSVLRGTTPLVIAGGGGGAGAAWQSSQGNNCAQGGANGNGGAAGGGDAGQTKGGAAAPGTQTAGGAAGSMATAGGPLQGGHGGKSTIGDGGAHGGGGSGGGPGCGSSGGGGGGGGWFGGGGGGYSTSTAGGAGGGGSGYVEPSATDLLLVTGKTQRSRTRRTRTTCPTPVQAALAAVGTARPRARNSRRPRASVAASSSVFRSPDHRRRRRRSM